MFRPVPIPGCEHNLVSEFGVVYNSKTNHFYKPQIDHEGYLSLGLHTTTPYKRLNTKVHRLVAMAFIPNPNNYPIVMHLDNNPGNPCVWNLKWGTQLDNMRQAFRENRVGKPSNYDFRKKYYYINKDDCPMCFIGQGSDKIADMLGTNRKNVIQKVCQGYKTLKHEDFKGWHLGVIEKKYVQRSDHGLIIDPQVKL